MVTTKSKKQNYLTEVQTGENIFYSDVAVDHGGSGQYASPGELFASSYAACINITTRMVLDRKQYDYEEVIVQVELDNENLDELKFYTHIEIVGDIEQEEKEKIIQKVKRCPVGRMMRANKEFLDQ